MEFVDGFAEFGTDVLILVAAELLALVLPEVESIKGILQGERVGDLELLPGDDTTRPNLIRLHLEAAILVAEEMGFLSENSWQDPDDGPTEETAIGRRVATVEERVLLLGVAVDVTVYPDLTFLVEGESLE